VLFFGTVRHYKGLDILLEALAKSPAVELIVAGEFWDDDKPYFDQINRLGLDSRVTVKPGYVAQADFGELFADADVLVLPYRSGTGSIVRELGFRFGLPVIATDVGAIAEGIDHGINGMVVAAEDPDALAEALIHASRPEVLAQWREGVASRQDTQAQLWESYCNAVLHGKTSPQPTPGGEK
jgi:glycosyltransferase involved in cell wall biosynthesis